jgi:tetratricopeptide (TPR) repeat protein
MQQVQATQAQPALADDARRFLLLLGYHENPQGLAAAETQVNQILNGNPNYIPGLFVRGLLQQQRGQPKEAIQTFEKVLSRFAQFTPAQRALAILYAPDPNQDKRAFDLATKAWAAAPNDPALARALGRLYHNRKEYPDAVRTFEQAALTLPADAESFYFLGNSYLQLKDWAKAKDALQKSVDAGLPEPLNEEARRLLSVL